MFHLYHLVIIQLSVFDILLGEAIRIFLGHLLIQRFQDIKYAELDNDKVVEINYTSGTTGFSKGVMLTGNNLKESQIRSLTNKKTDSEWLII